jgi:hypothetical protein
MSDKPTARSYSASTVSQKAAGPLAWGDKCFLCSEQIGETDPRGFYTGANNNAMMLAHRGCLNTFESNGNVWPEKKSDKPASAYQPIPIRVEPQETPSFAGTQIKFESFDELQDFIVKRGPLPSGVRVWLGDRALRE